MIEHEFNHLRWIYTTKYLNTSNNSSEALNKWYYTTTTKTLNIQWNKNGTNLNVKCWAPLICMCFLCLCTWFTERIMQIIQQRTQHAKRAISYKVTFLTIPQYKGLFWMFGWGGWCSRLPRSDLALLQFRHLNSSLKCWECTRLHSMLEIGLLLTLFIIWS